MYRIGPASEWLNVFVNVSIVQLHARARHACGHHIYIYYIHVRRYGTCTQTRENLLHRNAGDIIELWERTFIFGKLARFDRVWICWSRHKSHIHTQSPHIRVRQLRQHREATLHLPPSPPSPIHPPKSHINYIFIWLSTYLPCSEE